MWSVELKEFFSLHCEASNLSACSDKDWRFFGQFTIDENAGDLVLELVCMETFVQHFFVLPVLKTFDVANDNYKGEWGYSYIFAVCALGPAAREGSCCWLLSRKKKKFLLPASTESFLIIL